jgi:ribosomal protein S18 acetylase RimI-like enzyme
MLIRLCEQTDVDVLEQHMPTGLNRTHANLFARQGRGDLTYLVAWEDDGIPVGYVVINWPGFREASARERFPDVPELSNLGVSEDRRRRGIGTALIREVETRIRARGTARVGLAVEQGNTPAMRLYAGLGYQDSGFVCEGRYTWLDDAGGEHEEIEVCRHLTRDLRG